MKRVQLETWSSLERHCLTAAVVKVGDQNWTAVSRATSKLYEDIIKWRPDGDRHPPEWFSTKQCAAQYEHMLKTLSSRRKKRSERGGDQSSTSDSPADTLFQICYQEHMEDAKKKLAEQQLEIERLTKKVLDIMNGDYDDRLEEMLTEIEAKEREKDIKLKLKSKLGERCFAESSATITDPPDHVQPAAAQPDLLTTPTKATGKEMGIEPPKTSVTTSPLLTSLLQSPSPLTRPSSATPTISLLLNSSPPVPSNESPTLSKLLESSCPAGTPPNSTTSSSQLHLLHQSNPPAAHRPLQSPQAKQPHHRTSTMALSTALADHCLVAPDFHQIATSVPSAPHVPDDSKSLTSPQIEIATELVTKDAPQTLLSKGIAVVKQETVKSGAEKVEIPNTVSLQNETPQAMEICIDSGTPAVPVEPKEAVLVNDDDIVRKLDQLMDQVQNTLAENAVDEKSANDVLAVDESKVASSQLDIEIKTTASEVPTIETLDSTSSAVGLIVMGSGRPDGSLCIDTNRNMDGTQDDVSKGEEVPDIDVIQPSISGPDILSYGPSVEASLEAEQANDDNLLKSSRIDQTQLPAEIQVDEKISTVLSKEFPLTQYEMEGSRSEQTGLKRTLEVSNDSTVVSQSAGADDSIAGQVREALWPIEKTSTNDGTISPTLEKDPHLGAPSTESSKLIEKQIDGTVNELQDVDGSSFNAVEDDNIDQNDAGSHDQKKFLEENQTDGPKDNDSEKLEPNCHEDQTLDGATEVKACLDSIATENGKLKDSTGPTADHGKGDDAAEKLLLNSEHKGDTLSEKLTESKKQQTLEPERAEGSRTEQADGKQGDAVTVTDSLAPSNKRSEDTSSSPEESLAAKGSEDSDSTSSSLDKSFIIQNQPVVFVERTAVTEQKSSPSISPVETLPSSIESPKEILQDEKAPTPTNFSDDQVLGARTVSKQETFFQSEKNSDLTTVPGLSFEETEKKIRQVESDKDESTQGTKDETDDVNSVPESHFDDEEDTQDHDYIPPRVPAIEPDDVTVSTETTSDSYGDKLSLAEESEFSGEEKVDESESFPKTKRRKLSVDRKQRAATTEKSLLKTLQVEKMAAAIDDSKPTSGTKVLRRGRATPPTTSGERPLKEKRPVTPSSPSDSKDETSSRAGRKKRSTNISESSIPCSPSPSNLSNEDDKEYRAWKKSILLVYDRIAAHKYASVFMRPISEDDAPGYFKVILKPTDLTTIKKQIESGVIRTTVEFQRELMLMLSNALTYNKSDSLVFKMAFEMLQDVKEAMATMVQALGSGVPLDQLESSPATTARVSRASTSGKGGTSTSDSIVLPPIKRKRPTTSDTSSRLKRKRSDAS